MSHFVAEIRPKSKRKARKAAPIFNRQPDLSLSPAARRIARRFGLPAATAALIANLAGLGISSEVRTNG